MVLFERSSRKVALAPAGEVLLAEGGKALDAVSVDVIMCGIHERTAVLRDGRADVSLLHGSFADLHDLDTAELLVESRPAVFPRRHRLACRTSLTMADLRDEALPPWSARPKAQDVGQLIQLIALGRLVAVVPSSVRGQIRADLVPCRSRTPRPPRWCWRGRGAAARKPWPNSFVRPVPSPSA
ncbi:LysR substrate-binding domain-containing protein [Actinomadura terrae]|uniref:LysR substrate-binding domain-containing protein n=1 Tax=Actinomadura terrae TaxID=604353 RepID=UPI001FA6BF45|nr:LysR substrate-binding domain-containing protein [Actinomadura terrae]